MNEPADPTKPSVIYDLFGQPLVKPGEIVPVEPSMPTWTTRPAQAVTAAKQPGSPPNAGGDSSAAEQQRQRLLAQCQRLRASHRCPGRCVLSGELREGGLSVFRRFVDGEV